jgi:putative DNA primase/helicase
MSVAKPSADGKASRPAADNAGQAHRAALQAGQECLDAALRYLVLGWSVLPICPPDHVGVGKAHAKGCQSPGKAPWGPWKPFQDRLPTEDEIRQKWHDNPQLNVGMALGPVSGLVRVDVDGPGGEERLQQLSGGDLPDTLEFTSGRDNGGRGLLYAIPPGVQLRTTCDRPGKAKEELRLQAKGAQTVLPPSRHISGMRYAWKPGHSPGDRAAALAPPWLVQALQESAQAAGPRVKPLGDGEKISEGQRNDTLTSLAGTMRRRGLGEEAIFAALKGVNEEQCDPPLSEEEVRSIAQSVARYEPAAPPDGDTPGGDGQVRQEPERPNLTDVGNGKRLAARHGDDLRHCHPWKKWLVWSGRHWRPDAVAAPTRRTKETIASLAGWAADQVSEISSHLRETNDDEE